MGFFIKEHLTPKTKSLLKLTKDATWQKNCKYIWVHDGKILSGKPDWIFAKISDQSPVLKILSEDNLKINWIIF